MPRNIRFIRILGFSSLTQATTDSSLFVFVCGTKKVNTCVCVNVGKARKHPSNRAINLTKMKDNKDTSCNSLSLCCFLFLYYCHINQPKNQPSKDQWHPYLRLHLQLGPISMHPVLFAIKKQNGTQSKGLRFITMNIYACFPNGLQQQLQQQQKQEQQIKH